jgi:hypothetical protein
VERCVRVGVASATLAKKPSKRSVTWKRKLPGHRLLQIKGSLLLPIRNRACLEKNAGRHDMLDCLPESELFLSLSVARHGDTCTQRDHPRD